MTTLAAFDIGGTTTRVAVSDGVDETVCHFTTEINEDRPIASHISASLDATLEFASFDAGHLAGIGIGLPGSVDHKAGTVRLATNLGIDSDPYSLRMEISSHYGCPVEIENDVKTAALGLVDRLDDPAHDVLTYLAIGTGIASATVVNGQLLRGRRGSAGEVGQIVVAPNGRSIEGSLPGSLEAMAAGPSIREAANENGASLDATMLNAAKYLALGVHALFMTFDPHLFIVGGGVASSPVFQAHLKNAVGDLRAASAVAAAVIDPDLIVFLDDEEIPGLTGANYLASMAAQGFDRRSLSARNTGETL
jgi:predicted NBD/HSP70 family sugar kinase